MTFTGITPFAAAVIIVGSAAILAVLHILRVRSRQQSVVTTMFWATAVERPRARSLMHRFRHPRTYLLLVCICVLMAIALLRPQLAADSGDRVWEVIVLDAGASMSVGARTEGETRLDAAKDIAIDRIRMLNPNDRLAIIVTDPLPRLVHASNAPRSMAVKSILDIEPAATPSVPNKAIQLAVSLTNGWQNRRVVLITDETRVPAFAGDVTATDDVEVKVIRVGESADNAAIVAASFEPYAERPYRGRLTVRVAYWGEREREVEIIVQRSGGALLMREAVTMAADSVHDFAVADLLADGDELIAKLATDDAVVADNMLILHSPTRPAIYVGCDLNCPNCLQVALRTDKAVQLVKNCPHCGKCKVCSKKHTIESMISIAIVDEGPPVIDSQELRVASGVSFLKGLDFEGAVCGSGAAVPETPAKFMPLLLCGETVLAGVDEDQEKPVVYFSSAMFDEKATICQKPAFALLVAQTLRHLAGWVDCSASIPPERLLADPLWAKRAGEASQPLAMPGSRDSGNVRGQAAIVKAHQGQSFHWTVPLPFELVLIAVLLLVLVEAVLHVRGRIP